MMSTNQKMVLSPQQQVILRESTKIERAQFVKTSTYIDVVTANSNFFKNHSPLDLPKFSRGGKKNEEKNNDPILHIISHLMI